MYCAQDSSFCLFSSPFSSPNAVPSCSASIASCSLEVSCCSDFGLPGQDQQTDHIMTCRPRTHPPPVMIFPRSCSICKYSSTDIVGSRCPAWNTCACKRARSAAFDGRIMNGRNGWARKNVSTSSAQHNADYTHLSLGVQKWSLAVGSTSVKRRVELPHAILRPPPLHTGIICGCRRRRLRRSVPQEFELLLCAYELCLGLSIDETQEEDECLS